MKVVLVRFKDGERRDYPIQKESVVIGRRQDSDLRIATQDVSRQHCQVALNGERLRVKDLGSSNGTFVNGKRIAEQDLAAGDRLSVGPVTFVIQVDGKPAEIAPTDAEVIAAEEALEAPPRKTAPAKPKPAPAPPKPEADEEEIFELDEEDFDIEDAISSLEELDEDKDMP